MIYPNWADRVIEILAALDRGLQQHTFSPEEHLKLRRIASGAFTWHPTAPHDADQHFWHHLCCSLDNSTTLWSQLEEARDRLRRMLRGQSIPASNDPGACANPRLAPIFDASSIPKRIDPKDPGKRLPDVPPPSPRKPGDYHAAQARANSLAQRIAARRGNAGPYIPRFGMRPVRHGNRSLARGSKPLPE